MATFTQAGQVSGNAVAEKRFDFAYNDAGQFTSLNRYADVAGTEFVAETTYAYDGMGRLTSLQHAQGVTSLAGYDYTYDNASRITAIDSVLDGLTTYTNDHTGQLTDADHTGQTDESYDYDENGNRTSNTIGDNNQILSDGTYDYEYDDEGSMIAKETISTGERVEYVWDHRNRLVSIVTKNALGAVTKQVDQSYDVFQRWVRRSVDADGAGIGAVTDTFFGYEDNQIVLAFDGDDDTDLTNRYLWGEMVDQILADEQITSLSTDGDVLYPLTDHLNTTRDLATYDAGTNITTNANHRRFDSFGNIISESNGSITILVGFTARPFDTSTGLQWNLNRWFVSTLGVWMSEDPIGFDAGDDNLRRYVGNQVVVLSDPLGLAPHGPIAGFPPGYHPPGFPHSNPPPREVVIFVYDAEQNVNPEDTQYCKQVPVLAENLVKQGKVNIIVTVNHSMSRPEMMQEIIKALGKNKIKELIIFDHGTRHGAGQQLGNKWLTPRDFWDLRHSFADDSNIRLGGCNVGNVKHRNYMIVIANLTGSRVTAADDYVVVLEDLSDFSVRDARDSDSDRHIKEVEPGNKELPYEHGHWLPIVVVGGGVVAPTFRE